jgi:hypothetical protein
VADRKKQAIMLRASRRAYRQGAQYVTRKKLPSFRSRPSPHVAAAQRMYGVESVEPGPELARATGCSVRALAAIVRKGEGAYYSSGSRPNQTAQSWGKARLASALTAGKAAAVDRHILEEGCDRRKKAWILAQRAFRAYGKGQGRTRKVRIN